MTPPPAAADPGPPPGVVQVDTLSGGWFHVQLGRNRRVKRFNLSDAEARQLLDRLIVLGVTPSAEVRPLLDR
jgi:hypothetical protein